MPRISSTPSKPTTTSLSTGSENCTAASLALDWLALRRRLRQHLHPRLCNPSSKKIQPSSTTTPTTRATPVDRTSLRLTQTTKPHPRLQSPNSRQARHHPNPSHQWHLHVLWPHMRPLNEIATEQPPPQPTPSPEPPCSWTTSTFIHTASSL